jgi:hypothetical protein
MKPINYLIQEQEESLCKHCIKEWLFTGDNVCLWDGVVSCGINKKFSKCNEICTKEDWAKCPLNKDNK